MSYYLNNFSLRKELIQTKPKNNLGIIVVIPCCNEPDLISSLSSLLNCESPSCSVEVIVVINASENAEKEIFNQNKKTLLEAEEWRIEHQSKFDFYFIEENKLQKKHAGVGLARKIGMDEAVRRFEKVNHPKGIIACFDADARCETNYLTEIRNHFIQHPKTPACSIHFEHPTSGNDFPQEIYNGITQYELHLRYYKNGLAYAQLPFAYHTIGSSMAVRSDIYQKQNGMNKRKAGEDFYFLQKIIPLGNFTEINSTTITPSPRVSDRVPFGTGKAMQKWLDEEKNKLLSYNPQSFVDLKQFCNGISNLYNSKIDIPKVVLAYLNTINFNENLSKIRANSKSVVHFKELFFKWFNAFKVLKFMHFARDNYYADVLIFEGANELLKMLEKPTQNSLPSLLEKFKKMDKS